MREKRWYFLAFLLAASLRFLHLGALPLTDAEAALALQALHPPITGTDAAYILLTKIPFFLFHASNFWARFFPALGGSLLVLAPYAFREKLGSRAAILLSFALALDPGMVAASRQAGGMILALAFVVFAIACWESECPRLAGIFAAFALFGGKMIWAGALSFFLAWILARGLLLEEEEGAAPSLLLRLPKENELRQAGLAAGIAILLGGTLFFLAPKGLNAAASAFPSYLFGWVVPAGVSPALPFEALLAYEGFALLFGILGAIRGWMQKDKILQWMSLWAGTAFFLVILYPSRDIFYLLWVILPLWILASKEIVRYFRLPKQSRMETLAAAALTFFLIAFGWLNLASLSLLPMTSISDPTHIGLALGAFVLVVASLLLISYGWSIEVAIYGGFWGIFLALTLYTLGTAFGAAELRLPRGTELWERTPPPPQADLLLQTVENLSDWSAGEAHAQPITIAGVNSPALYWLLREYDIEITDSVSLTHPPALLITPPIDSPGLPAQYRGQDFVWRETPNWRETSPLAWFFRRETVSTSDSILLWAREDLFLDSQQPNTP